MIKESLSRDQFRLYQLIWKRFTASRMSSAVYETTSIQIGAGEFRFHVSASRIAFEGFMSVYTSEEDEKGENNVLLKSLDKDTELKLKELEEKQHFTQPPAHFTEASLVKALEEQGIGRPSTYAPTITTLLGRRYVVKENKNLYITELGEAVNSIMMEAFPTIVDENFTANMESLLDKVISLFHHVTAAFRTFLRRRLLPAHKLAFRIVLASIVFSALFRFFQNDFQRYL